jgi:hypothetical protein
MKRLIGMMHIFAPAHNDISKIVGKRIENVAALQHDWCGAMRLAKY